MSADGLPSPSDVAGMSEAQLARWSRDLHTKTARVKQAAEALHAAAPAGSAMSAEQEDAVAALRMLSRRLAEHRLDIDREQAARRARIRASVDERREAEERAIDEKVAKAIAAGERRVAERRADLLHEARRKGVAYERRLAEGRRKIDDRQQEAMEELEEASAANARRLEQKRAAAAAKIVEDAERKKRQAEAKARDAEARRGQREEELRRRIAAREERAADAPANSIGSKLPNPVLVAAERAKQPKVATLQRAPASSPAPSRDASLPRAAASRTSPPPLVNDRLTKTRKQLSMADVDKRHAAGAQRGSEARDELAASVKRQCRKREERHAKAAARVEDEQDTRAFEREEKEKERQRRMAAALEEQQALQERISVQRQAKRDGALQRAKSTEPSAYYAEVNAERQVNKALAAMAAVCSELLGHPAPSPSPHLPRAVDSRPPPRGHSSTPPPRSGLPSGGGAKGGSTPGSRRRSTHALPPLEAAGPGSKSDHAASASVGFEVTVGSRQRTPTAA